MVYAIGNSPLDSQRESYVYMLKVMGTGRELIPLNQTVRKFFRCQQFNPSTDIPSMTARNVSTLKTDERPTSSVQTGELNSEISRPVISTANIVMSPTVGLPFCDIKSYDSVFNIGHLIHFMRCGQIYTYDPRMNGGIGGFLRDWTLFAYGRHWFGENIIKAKGRYDDEYLRFNGFSFQEINCITSAEDFNRTCYRSAQGWDRLTV
ncbi:unnamed protein product, partial [Medioppia subpectinata]